MAPMVLDKIMERTIKYVTASDINIELAIYAIKALAEIIENSVGSLAKHHQHLMTFLMTKILTLRKQDSDREQRVAKI